MQRKRVERGNENEKRETKDEADIKTAESNGEKGMIEG